MLKTQILFRPLVRCNIRCCDNVMPALALKEQILCLIWAGFSVERATLMSNISLSAENSKTDFYVDYAGCDVEKPISCRILAGTCVEHTAFYVEHPDSMTNLCRLRCWACRLDVEFGPALALNKQVWCRTLRLSVEHEETVVVSNLYPALHGKVTFNVEISDLCRTFIFHIEKPVLMSSLGRASYEKMVLCRTFRCYVEHKTGLMLNLFRLRCWTSRFCVKSEPDAMLNKQIFCRTLRSHSEHPKSSFM